jgi:hypothetical protein
MKNAILSEIEYILMGFDRKNFIRVFVVPVQELY